MPPPLEEVRVAHIDCHQNVRNLVIFVDSPFSAGLARASETYIAQ